MLAIRIIHYTAAKLIWECKVKVDCKCKMRETSEKTLKQELDEALEVITVTASSDNLSAAEHAADIGWKAFRTYTTCDITFPSYRMPAISGLAHLFPI